jgi:hypothetical protein
MFSFAFIFLCASMWDAREVDGLNPWVKPFKFSVSIGIYYFTYAYALRDVVNEGLRRKWELIVAAVGFLEISLISLQAARGITSHYNFASPFTITVYVLMGLGIGINTLMIAVLGRHLSKRPGDYLSPLTRFACVCGLRLAFLGSLIGVIMSLRNSSFVGGEPGGPGIPLLGWSTEIGDLRPVHFLGLHGFQAPIVLAFFLRGASEPKSRSILNVVTFGWGFLTLLALGWALTGHPFF